MRMIDVAQAVAGLAQDQSGIMFDQQAVADEPAERAEAAPVEQGAADRAIGAAIEVVDFHLGLPRSPGRSGQWHGAAPVPGRGAGADPGWRERLCGMAAPTRHAALA